MRRLFLALAVNSFLAATCAYSQSNPPCNAGVHTLFNETIIPLQNGNITYCISDYGWSDTWMLGTPAGYNKFNDVLSGDDAFNLKYDTPPGGLGSGTGWLSPSLDRGTLSAQDSPGWAARRLWNVVTHVHPHPTLANTTESVIQNDDGVQITIDAYAPPGTFGVQIALTIVNTSAQTITGFRLADYFNFHPNGSDAGLNLFGTTLFDGNCIVTTGQPIVIMNGSACGLFAPVQHDVGFAYAKGAIPAVWDDVGNEAYNGVSGPLGPDDTAGAMEWNLGNLAPGAAVRFAVGKNINPFSPPLLAKAFINPGIPIGGISALTFTVTNPNTLTLSGIAFSDTLPANVFVASPLATSGACGGGTISATAGGSTIQLTGATLAGGASCAFSVNVTGNIKGIYTNTTSPVSSNEGGQGSPATAVLTVSPPPVISKSFAPVSIAPGATSTLTFAIANPGPVALTGVGFSDNFPAGVAVAPTPGTTNTCGGTLTGFTNGSTAVSLAGGTISAGATCTITVSVVGSTAGVKNNVTSVVTSNEGGPGNTASAILTVVSPLSIAKVFNPATIPVGSTSVLTFTITNLNPSVFTGVGFNDAFPAGVAVAPTPGTTNTCGGTLTGFTSGSAAVSLSGGTIPANATCAISVTVVGSTAGVKNNVTSVVTSNEGGAGNTASATLTVVAPPSISKAFNPASIPLGGTSVLTFTLTNPNASAVLTGVGFSDVLPAGVAVAATPGTANTCSGTLTGFTSGSTTISLAGGTLAAGGTCTVSVSVIGSTAGTKNNVTTPITSTEGGPGNTASATLAVIAPPSISKAFNPTLIQLGGNSVLTFTIVNPNASALTNIGFNDVLPAGLAVAATPGTTNTCGGALTGFTAGSTTLSLSGGTLAGGGTCVITVSIVGNTAGTKNNVTTPVTSTEGGPGNTASATLIVGPPLNISKVFNPASIPVGGTSVLTFTLNNPNTFAFTGVTFSDAFPAGVAVAATPGTTNTCGGTLTGFTAGSANVSLAGGTLPAGGTCSISVTVVGNTAGTKNNVTSIATSTEGGSGGPASATLVVIAPPAISKAFNPASIPVGGTSVLTFTVTNPNTSALTGVGFSDTFPAGVAVAAAPNTTNTCGGTLTGFTAGSGTVALAGGSIAGGANCVISVSVIGNTAGTKNNVTSAVTSIEGGIGNTASATLVVNPPLSISKVFNPASVAVGGTSVLTFTLSNSTAVLHTGVGFTDTFPAGVAVAATPGVTNTCGGTLTGFTSGSTSIALAGGSIAAGGTCTVVVSVVGNTSGTKNNVTTPVTSNEGGNGNTASATLVVGIIAPVISKAFGEVSIGVNSTTTLTFTLVNPNSDRTLTQVAFTDTLPTGLHVAVPNGLTGTCNGGSITAAAGGTTVSLSGATFTPLATCTFTLNVTGVSPGLQINTTGPVLSAEAPPGAPATANILVGNPYQLTYLANLNRGDSFIDITNTGASGADLTSGTTASITGAICANIYVFSPDEQMVSCCSCPVTPNGLVSLSANTDLIGNTLTPTTPTSVVVKVVASTPVGNTCNNSAAAVTAGTLANGAAAYSTTLHATPAAGTFAPTEKPFSGGTLSAAELARLTGLCNFILSNGSGFGVCRSCRLGGLGADRQ